VVEPHASDETGPSSSDPGHAQFSERMTDRAPVPDVRLVTGTDPLVHQNPGVFAALLWCLLLLVLTQLLPGIIAGMLMAVFDPSQLSRLGSPNSHSLLNSPAYSRALLVALVLGQSASLVVVLRVLRSFVGNRWADELHVRVPHVREVGLVLLALPAFVFLSMGLDAFGESAFPSFFDVEGAMFVIGKWPLMTGILVIGVAPGISEELWFRGFFGRGLVSRLGTFGGVFLTSLLFGLFHWDPRVAVKAMGMGAVLHLLYLVSRSLLVPMLLHISHNAVGIVVEKKLWPTVFGRPADEVPSSVLVLSVLLLLAIAWAFLFLRARASQEDLKPNPYERLLRRPSLTMGSLVVTTILFFACAIQAEMAAQARTREEEAKIQFLPESVRELREAPVVGRPWTRFHFTSRVQIDFPSKLCNQGHDEIALKDTQVSRMAYSSVIPRPQLSFWLDYIDLEPRQMRTLSDEECFRALEERITHELKQGKVIREEPILINGKPGREIWSAGDDTVVVTRMCAVPVRDCRRYFFLMVRGIGVRPHSKDLERFFRSFEWEWPDP
jgi:membrane protease YdiL (CAAX protease family)